MKCNNCNSNIPENTNKCPYCGAAVENVNLDVNQFLTQQVSNLSDSQKKKANLILKIIPLIIPFFFVITMINFCAGIPKYFIITNGNNMDLTAGDKNFKNIPLIETVVEKERLSISDVSNAGTVSIYYNDLNREDLKKYYSYLLDNGYRQYDNSGLSVIGNCNKDNYKLKIEMSSGSGTIREGEEYHGIITYRILDCN